MSKKSNRARKFNSIMHYVNESWAARVLGMQVNPQQGIDLLGKKADVETKFCMQIPGSYVHMSWRVLEYQMKYKRVSAQAGKPALWGLAKYWLSVPVQEIRTQNQEELESLVSRRELYLVPWGWMNQFPAYHQSGKTQMSEWNHKIRFPKARLLPEIQRTYKVEKGLVHLTTGVNPSYF